MSSPVPVSDINLSLVSHTNVGKTSLMRTLLRQDIGEVADRPHVTEQAEAHVLIDSGEGDVLTLWDTPGFGDSARLLKRLMMSDNPIGWLQTQVWDRFVDRPFFSSQQAVRNVRDAADVVLYLVNASEDPSGAAYVAAEMRILGWIGKPVLVLLNQTGPARGHEAERAEEAAWSHALQAHVGEHRVMALDAFARCWVQEDRLLAEVGALLPPPRHASFERMRAAWRRRNLDAFDASMEALARQLAAAAVDREPVADAAGTGKAMAALATRLDRAVRENTDRLIALHGLSGRASQQILARLAGQFDVAQPLDARKTGIIGGLVSGALGGLAADLSAGGLTLGAGALIGGILGAFGVGGATRAINAFRGTEQGRVRWGREFLSQRVRAALLRYLAVAHYGRGRGAWAEAEYPPHWLALVEGVVAARQAELDAAWSAVEEGAGEGELAGRLRTTVAACGSDALTRLYPEAAELLAGRRG